MSVTALILSAVQMELTKWEGGQKRKKKEKSTSLAFFCKQFIQNKVLYMGSWHNKLPKSVWWREEGGMVMNVKTKLSNKFMKIIVLKAKSNKEL